MTLKELQERHKSRTGLGYKSVKAQIRVQLQRRCLHRGCNESLAFSNKQKVLCDIHRGKPLVDALKTNSKKKPVKRITKLEQRRINKLKKQRFYDKHGIVFNKQLRRKIVQDSGKLAEEYQLIYENYKEPLKRIPRDKGYGYYGTLATTADKELLQCHICGKLYGGLNSHVRYHKITVPDYKKRFGLSERTALVADSTRVKFQKNVFLSKGSKIPAHLEAYNKAGQPNARRGAGTGHKMSLEQRNKRGVCPDQVLEKIKELEIKLGRTPSHDEFRNEYNYRYVGSIKYQFGSWSNAIHSLGKQTMGELRHPDKTKLIEDLLNFQKTNGRIPMTSDFNRGLLRDRGVYIRQFGSLNNARIEAGMDAVIPMPFGKIITLPPAQYLRYKQGLPVEEIKTSGKRKALVR